MQNFLVQQIILYNDNSLFCYNEICSWECFSSFQTQFLVFSNKITNIGYVMYILLQLTLHFFENRGKIWQSTSLTWKITENTASTCRKRAYYNYFRTKFPGRFGESTVRSALVYRPPNFRKRWRLVHTPLATFARIFQNQTEPHLKKTNESEKITTWTTATSDRETNKTF